MNNAELEQMAEKNRKEREHFVWLYDGAIAVSEELIQVDIRNSQNLWEYLNLRIALSRREVLEQQNQFILTR